MAKSPKHKKQTRNTSSKAKPIDQAVTSKLPKNSWIASFLMVFCFLLYSNTLSHDYTQDDAIVIYNNMYTTKGIAGIPDILKYDTFKGFFKEEGKDKLVSGGRYRPFTLIMFAVEWDLFKRVQKDNNGRPVLNANGQPVYEGNKFIFHLISILLYGLTTVLVYLVILKLFAPDTPSIKAFTIAFITAIIFAAHPLHTEAVANIKGRDEIMTLLGALGAAYFSLKAFYEEKFVYNILAFILFFIALLSKENAITFLAIVPLMYWFFTKSSMARIGKQAIPFFAAAILFLVIRGSILGNSLGEPPLELMNNPYLKIVDGRYIPFSFAEKMATIIFTLGKYVQLLIFPHPLTHDYYPRHIEIMNFGNIWVILSLVLYLGMSIYALLGLVKKDAISFGIIFFLATTSIISNIVFPVGTNMSERFMFMPSVGFALVLAILLWRLAMILNKKEVYHLKQLSSIGIGIVLLVLAFSAKTFTRNFAWKNDFTLFHTDVHTSKNSAKLLNAAGGSLITEAIKPKNKTDERKMLEEAQVYLKKAIEIHPNYGNAYLLLGNSANYLGDYDTAIQYYNHLLQMNPNHKDANNNLGITYRDAGKAFGMKGNLSKAEVYLNKALQIRGEEYETLRLLGIVFGSQGKHQPAIQYFLRALKLEPNNAQANYNLAQSYVYAQEQDKASQYLQKARNIDPQIDAKQARNQ